MKQLSYFLLAALFWASTACGNREQSRESAAAPGTAETELELPSTKIRFSETAHDFGQVQEGKKVTHTFEFVNTGTADLVLQSVKASCGCTVPKYSREPVRPGKKGSIEVAFNTKGRPGKQHKSVTVKTNTEPQTTVLSVSCEVLPKKEK
jgi:hypothetical protein